MLGRVLVGGGGRREEERKRGGEGVEEKSVDEGERGWRKRVRWNNYCCVEGRVEEEGGKGKRDDDEQGNVRGPSCFGK